MPIRRISNSTISNSGKGKYSNFMANYYSARDEMDILQTSRVSTVGGTSSVLFSNIPSTYQNLQLRYMVPSSVADNNMAIRFNLDSGANYTLHEVRAGGDGSASSGNVVSVGFARVGYWQTGSLTYPYVGIVDIFDYASTTKNKTVRAFSGGEDNVSGLVRINSSVWLNTSAITSITFLNANSNVPQNSKITLYGVI